ncbi:hypothetical protein TNIN_91081 [Trichonephila inaurata madagascariensis]|uniref:Uncharacterized protein n=1 Tax=Trichonephila inaurata madagascariensis TaxID=2747483 RepID=A0A8X6YU07_9ARAC|nr:hypothetical protein TNIN_91081 [Trichonephila inaurata madagascariensis]
MILLFWVCFSIRFLFFSSCDILFLPPLLLLFDAFQNNNNIQGQLSGDSDPEAKRPPDTGGQKIQEERETYSKFRYINTDHDTGRAAKNRK